MILVQLNQQLPTTKNFLHQNRSERTHKTKKPSQLRDGFFLDNVTKKISFDSIYICSACNKSSVPRIRCVLQPSVSVTNMFSVVCERLPIFIRADDFRVCVWSRSDISRRVWIECSTFALRACNTVQQPICCYRFCRYLLRRFS